MKPVRHFIRDFFASLSTMTKKELKVILTTPFILCVISFSLLLTGYFFYTDLLYFSLWNGRNLNDLWALFFNDVRFVLMIITPLLTMRLFAEEESLGTIELLRTYPINSLGIVIAKYIVSMITLFVILISSVLMYPLLLSFIWKVDFSVIMCGGIGLFLFGMSLISIGLFFSSLTKSQLFAAGGTYGMVISLWYLTWNEAVAREKIVIILNKLSLFYHFTNFTEGIISLKDVVYFIVFILMFVYLTFTYFHKREI